MRDLGLDNKAFNLGSILFGLHPHGRGAVGAEVLILIPFGEHQEQPLSHRHRRLASSTVEGGCFKLVKTSLSHKIIIKEKGRPDNRKAGRKTCAYRSVGLGITLHCKLREPDAQSAWDTDDPLLSFTLFWSFLAGMA